MRAATALGAVCAFTLLTLARHHEGWAQHPTDACSVNIEPTPLEAPTQWFEMREAWRNSLLLEIDLLGDGARPDGEFRSIERMWRGDSVAMEWSLADLVADDFRVDRARAIIASDLYARYSGKATPILQRLSATNAGPLRWSLGLGAIREKLRSDEAMLVEAFACETTRFLRNHSSTDGPLPFPDLVWEMEQALMNACTLISPKADTRSGSLLYESLSNCPKNTRPAARSRIGDCTAGGNSNSQRE